MIEFNDFSVLAWNIRGAANVSAKRHVRDLLRVNHPTLVFLFETKVQFASVVGFWKSEGYVPVHVEEAQGLSGGIWCLKQDSAPFSFSVMESTGHAVTIRIDALALSWCCTGVYASPSPVARASGWEYLKALRRRVALPWMLVGDFNETLLPSDQNRGSFTASRAEKLARVVDECELLDIHPSGYRFTWARKRVGEPLLLKKLD